MPTDTSSRLIAGISEPLRPGLRRVLAPNPSPLTGAGTNSYILGEGRVALIDPGPEDERHLAALVAALAPGERVEAIIVTHAHRDHSGLAARAAAALNAPVLAYGPAGAGANPALAALGDLGGGEGLDRAFRPDALLGDGETVNGPDWSLTAIHTPGHLGNHLCLQWGEDIFSGDQAMGWSTSIVSPPDGDMTAYMASLLRLAELAPRHLFPGHGAEVIRGSERLAELIAHRRGRESQILAALAGAEGSAADLAARIYVEVAPTLLPAATRNVLSHLLDLEAKNIVWARGSNRIDAVWGLV